MIAKAFSLLELIIVILIIAIISYFLVPKLQDVFLKTHLTQLKSNVAIIQNNISKLKSKEILLLSDFKIDKLDDARVNIKDEKLFTKVIDFDIFSTDNETKELGKWIKTSTLSYEYFLASNQRVLFEIENNIFICKSSIEICKEIE